MFLALLVPWRRRGATLRTLVMLALGSSLFLASAATAQAQSVESVPEIYQVRCFNRFGVIDVRRLDVTPEIAREVVASHDEAYAAANNLYVPAWHAHLYLKPTNPHYGIEPKTYTCPSPAGGVELVILPEPLFKQLWISVTLRIGDRVIVDDLPFNVCQPVTAGSIERMRFNGTDGSLTFWGYFGGHYHKDPKPPGENFDNSKRRFIVEPNAIRTLDQWALGWTVRNRPLVHIDIDYAGTGYDSSHFHQRGPYLGDCRYVGPGMPDSRWRDEDWEFRTSDMPVEDQGQNAPIVAAGLSRD